LALGAAFIVVHRMYDLRGLPTFTPQTAEQSRQQVLGPARQIIATGSLQQSNASYLLQSCSSDDQPPYQGTLYVGFAVPGVVQTRALFRQIAQTMQTQGWRIGLPPGRHPDGWTLAKGGVIAVYYRDPDQEGRGVLRVYGECRDVADHRLDGGGGFLDVTRELNR
jgi:hypothetical protein